jgi:hypothetical protein
VRKKRKTSSGRQEKKWRAEKEIGGGVAKGAYRAEHGADSANISLSCCMRQISYEQNLHGVEILLSELMAATKRDKWFRRLRSQFILEPRKRSVTELFDSSFGALFSFGPHLQLTPYCIQKYGTLLATTRSGSSWLIVCRTSEYSM